MIVLLLMLIFLPTGAILAMRPLRLLHRLSDFYARRLGLHPGQGALNSLYAASGLSSFGLLAESTQVVKRVFGNVCKRMRTLTPPVAASRGQVKVRKCARH